MTSEEFQREILQRLAGIESAIQQLTVSRSCGPKDADIETLRRLLPAIAGRHGSSAFRASEVLADPIWRELAGSINSQRLGMVFARCEGIEIDGRYIQRVTAEGGVLLWEILGSLSSSPRPTVAIARRRAG